MADQFLLGVGDISSPSSDAGNLNQGAQSLYLAEKEADDGHPEKATYYLDHAWVYFGQITDPTTIAQAQQYDASARGYVKQQSLANQQTLQENFAAQAGNVQQAAVLSPDQRAAYLADNAQTEAASKSSVPWLAYAASTTENAAGDAAAAAADGAKKLADAAKWPALIVGGLLLLGVGAVVALKVLL